MTKRPKLNLSSPQQNTKKRPSTFKVATAPSKPARDVPPKPPAKPAASTPSLPQASVATPARAKRVDVSHEQQSSWLNAGTIAKAVFLVGAAALSFFLLKRRLR